MRVIGAKIVGSFDSEQNPFAADDPACRVSLNSISVVWQWRHANTQRWLLECVTIPAGTRWRCKVYVDYVGLLLPSWVECSSASLVHNHCIHNCLLANGKRMDKIHADLLLLDLVRWLAKHRVVGGWKYRPQLALAESLYYACMTYEGLDWEDHEHSEHK